MELLSLAVQFAAQKHNTQRRKGTDIPYLLHPMEVAAIVGTITSDPCILAAAVLHDVVEDTDATPEEICEMFGARVAQLVAAESENKKKDRPAAETWMLRKQETINALQNTTDIAVKMICLGDKLSNLRSFKRDYTELGTVFFQRFNQKDPQMHRWYHRNIADAMPELMHTDAWKEYDALIRTVFNGEDNGTKKNQTDF
ncbi:MAG: HD domain-containing protein [Clostridia bacterium]|nr:HD domain-containing protein [Clostridia bacterium]MBR2413799.1 HD domain-containing protein [Clostridia bacterium]